MSTFAVRPSVTHLSPADAERRRRLVRMKVIATALLAGMAVVYVIAHVIEVQHPWAGYVRAAAEAGMVGALADWFAVTALFRRPFGLPIPHTAIIPNRKDAIGESLSEFVASNFLSEQVVRDRLARFSLASKLGGFLSMPGGAERVTAEIASVVRGAAAIFKDDEIAAMLERLALSKIADTKIGPPIGQIAAGIFERGDHHGLVDVVVDRLSTWVHDNPDAVATLVIDRAPTWTPRFLDGAVAGRIYREVDNFLFAVQQDHQHPVRLALDRFLVKFAKDLQTDPATIAKAETIKERVLNNEQVRSLASSAWSSIKNTLLQAAEDPNSELRRSVTQGLRSLGQELESGGSTAVKVDNWVADAAGYVARNHARSITGIIDETIARWDGQATSRKIELQVGRDLQFIRINGTVVGALAGLLIYSLSQWLLL